MMIGIDRIATNITAYGMAELLFPLLGCIVVWGAEGLRVVGVEEEGAVAFVGLDVVHNAGCCHCTLILAHLAQWRRG